MSTVNRIINFFSGSGPSTRRVTRSMSSSGNSSGMSPELMDDQTRRTRARMSEDDKESSAKAAPCFLATPHRIKGASDYSGKLPTTESEIIDILDATFDSVITRDSEYNAHMWDFKEFANDPKNPVMEFLSPLVHRLNLSITVYAVSAYYLWRVHQNHPSVLITPSNAHRLWIVSMMLAAKYIEDHRYKLQDWSCVSGNFFSARTLVQCEREFLNLLGFECYVDVRDLESFCAQMAKKHKETPLGLGRAAPKWSSPIAASENVV